MRVRIIRDRLIYGRLHVKLRTTQGQIFNFGHFDGLSLHDVIRATTEVRGDNARQFIGAAMSSEDLWGAYHRAFTPVDDLINIRYAISEIQEELG
jgi:hypothetical protein